MEEESNGNVNTGNVQTGNGGGVPSDIDVATPTIACRLSAGQVCICPKCEAARTRLLHRHMGAVHNHHQHVKKQVPKTAIATNATTATSAATANTTTLTVSSSKRRRVVGEVSSTSSVSSSTAGGGLAMAEEEDDDNEEEEPLSSNFKKTKKNHDDDNRNHDEVVQTVVVTGADAGGGLHEKEDSGITTASAASKDTTTTTTMTRMDEQTRLETMKDACKTILECIGETPDREGLIKTPERWAKALMFMTKGYCQTVEDVTNNAVFQEDHDEMVVVKNIDIHSLCEHHMVPFTGRISIGYIPNGKVIGLSKLARIAEVYARRLQVQERLTRQIADAVVDAVEPLGVGVVIECTHMCMVMRGVQKVGTSTTTSSVRGCFETSHKTRQEFFNIINSGMKMC